MVFNQEPASGFNINQLETLEFCTSEAATTNKGITKQARSK
jgi:hypothetical protein